jgi:hypothetical protein
MLPLRPDGLAPPAWTACGRRRRSLFEQVGCVGNYSAERHGSEVWVARLAGGQLVAVQLVGFDRRVLVEEIFLRHVRRWVNAVLSSTGSSSATHNQCYACTS